MTHRYKAIVEYDGTGFAGWQQQRHQAQPTVQEAVEVALLRYCGDITQVHAAGRTDAGVHATGQVIHFDLKRPREPYEIQSAVNHHVRPYSIVLREVKAVASDFHARFNAKQRHYHYHILNRTAPPALMAGYVWHVPVPLDPIKMHEAVQALVGKHDFSSFRSAHCSAQSAIRTLDIVTVSRSTEEHERIIIHIAARSFLHNQVRIIVGHLYQAGRGIYKAQDIEAILAARDRTKGAFTAPAHGLYLTKVVYDI